MVAALEARELGATGIAVSAIGLGAGQLGRESLDESEAARLLHGAVDLGVALIDTAPSYGLSEERIGRHLGARRARVALSTKLGYGVEGVADWTAAAIAGGIDAALARLRTDVIDVAHLHSCPLELLEREELRRALADAVAAGKVRAAGYAGDNDELRRAEGCGDFAVLETSINLCDQGASALVAATRLGVIAKRPLANAAWRFERRPPGDEAGQYWDRLRRMELAPQGVPTMSAFGHRSDLTATHELAIRYAAHHPGVDAAIVGTSSLEHLRQSVELSARGPLDADTLAAIAAAWSRVGTGWRATI